MVSAETITWLENNGFFTAPASTKYHGNYEGGLFDHSLAVMNALVELTENNGLIWGRKRSPYIVGMFHDLCKIDQYRVDNSEPYTVGEPTRYIYRTDTLLKGHGDKSVMLLSQHLKLTEEEVLCIRYHMGAFTEKEEWSDYTRAIHECPTVLWTHQADMIASHVHNI
jgi:HD superfamily phosphohydrolase YqeK